MSASSSRETVKLGWRARVNVLVSCALFAGAGPDGASREREALARVNHYRALAGLAPVVLDEKMSLGCREHVRYLALNAGSKAIEGLGAHHQDPKLPGATPAGAECGRSADLSEGAKSLSLAVDGWMNTLYHRRPILDPDLSKIGVGASGAPGSIVAALMFGKDPPAKTHPAWPVKYPVAGQKDVPLAFEGEIPNPVPNDGRGGYPVTLQFPAFDPVEVSAAELVDSRGLVVPAHVSHPTNPAGTFGQYGVICLIAKEPLAAGVEYAVRIRAKWKSESFTNYEWKFSTIAATAVDALDTAKLAAADRTPADVRGIVTHGWTVPEKKRVFLALKTRDRARTVALFMPDTEWTALAAGVPIDRFVGREVEVRAQVDVQGTNIFLEVGSAKHFRVAPLEDVKVIDARETAELVAHEDRLVLVRGVVTYGGRMEGTNDVFLALATKDTSKMVSVIVDAALWPKIAHSAAPAAMKGRTIEIRAPVKLHQKYVNLNLAAPEDLRFFP